MASSPEVTSSHSDARIVAQVREGDRAAFADLVDRYHAPLLVAAERITGHREDALDVVQDVLVKAYRRRDDLRHPERLGAWLLRIARNHAIGLIRRRRHEGLEFRLGEGTSASGIEHDAFPSDEPSPGERAELRELAVTVRGRLGELEAEYAEALRLHYLEGLDLPEIARRTGVPEGTVKWRLWRARQRLRKELMMSEVSDDLRDRATAQPLLAVGTVWGAAGPNRELHPWEVAKSLLAQQILFAARKEPRTAKELAREVKADASYVSEHLARLAEAGLLEEVDGRHRADFILLDEGDIARARGELGRSGARVAGIVKRHAGDLSRALGKLSPSARGFDEGHLGWIILPTMVLNFGVRRRLERTKGLRVRPPARPCGGAWFFKPQLAEGGLPVELGCNWSGGRNGHAQYWNSDINVTMTRPGMEEAVILYRLGDGPLPRPSLVDVFGEETLAGMIEHGLARLEGDRVAANVPVFNPPDGDVLDPVLGSIIDDIVDEVYGGFPDDVYALLDSLGFSFVRGDYPAHAIDLAQLGAVRALVEAGVLPAAPSKPRPGWGFFAWRGTFAPMELR